MTNKPADIEEGLAFTPKFDANGLVTVVVTDAKSGDVLMVAHMRLPKRWRPMRTRRGWLFTLWRPISRTSLCRC